MKKLLITLAFTLTMFCVNAQSLIADETTIKELKASIKIETSNEAIFNLILKNFEIKKYTVEILSDRAGVYKSYTF